MDSVTGVVMMWANEGLIVLGVLLAVVMFHYLTRVWSSPVDVVLGLILGASIFISTTMLFLTRHIWGLGLGLSTRASCFIVLYLWCIFGMLYFAGAETSRLKLFMAFVIQAGILYALYVFL